MAVAGLTLAVSAQKNDQKKPPKDPPPVVNPGQKPPKDRPPKEEKPKKPNMSFFVFVKPSDLDRV